MTVPDTRFFFSVIFLEVADDPVFRLARGRIETEVSYFYGRAPILCSILRHWSFGSTVVRWKCLFPVSGGGEGIYIYLDTSGTRAAWPTTPPFMLRVQMFCISSVLLEVPGTAVGFPLFSMPPPLSTPPHPHPTHRATNPKTGGRRRRYPPPCSSPPPSLSPPSPPSPHPLLPAVRFLRSFPVADRRSLVRSVHGRALRGVGGFTKCNLTAPMVSVASACSDRERNLHLARRLVNVPVAMQLSVCSRVRTRRRSSHMSRSLTEVWMYRRVVPGQTSSYNPNSAGNSEVFTGPVPRKDCGGGPAARQGCAFKPRNLSWFDLVRARCLWPTSDVITVLHITDMFFLRLLIHQPPSKAVFF